MDISSRTKHFISIGLIVFTGLFVFSDVLGHDFLSNWDDEWYVIRNEWVRGVTVDHLKNSFTRVYLWNYAPVNLISYMVDYEVDGLNPAVFHATNLLLHILNACLVYLVVLAVHARFAAALGAGLLFLIHPAQVESVAWIAERKNVLAFFFFAWSFLAYVRHRQAGRAVSYVLSLVLFVLALLSKSAAAVLPLMLVLYEYFFAPPAGRKFAQTWRMAAPFFVFAAVFGLMAVSHQSGGDDLYFGTDRIGSILTIPYIFSKYLLMLIYPVDLAAFYHVAIQKRILSIPWISSFLVMCLVLGLLIHFCRRKHPAGFWISAALFLLAPMLQVVPMTTPMNDRYLYFPMFGIAAAFGLAIDRLWPKPPSARLAFLGIAAGIFCALIRLTGPQVAMWENSLLLWSRTAQISPESPLARQKYAEALFLEGRYAESISEYDRAAALGRQTPDIWLHRGVAHRQLWQLDKALEDFNKLSHDPRHRETGLKEIAATRAMSNP